MQRIREQSRTLLNNVSVNSSISLIFQELVKTGIVRADEVKRIGQEEDVGRSKAFFMEKVSISWIVSSESFNILSPRTRISFWKSFQCCCQRNRNLWPLSIFSAFHKFKLHLITHPDILDMFSEFHRSNWWLPLKWSIEVRNKILKSSLGKFVYKTYFVRW